MSYDLKGICDGLATRYAVAGLNAAKPTGAEAMRKVYAQAPHSIPTTPCIVFMPQEGTIIPGSGVYEVDASIELIAYFSKRSGDVERSETQRQLWLGVLIEFGFSKSSWTLSGDVKSALPATWEFTERPYGGDEYDAIVITFQPITRDIPMPS